MNKIIRGRKWGRMRRKKNGRGEEEMQKSKGNHEYWNRMLELLTERCGEPGDGGTSPQPQEAEAKESL